MDFFEKIGETITTFGKEATDKAKEFAEIANLKSQIHTCEEVMKNCPEDIFAKQCTAIKNAQEGKTALEEKVKELKNL